jgi:hypothetical protein
MVEIDVSEVLNASIIRTVVIEAVNISETSFNIHRIWNNIEQTVVCIITTRKERGL